MCQNYETTDIETVRVKWKESEMYEKKEYVEYKRRNGNERKTHWMQLMKSILKNKIKEVLDFE